MFRIRLGISYDGTGYGGFQIRTMRPDPGELEKALAVIYKQPLRTPGWPDRAGCMRSVGGHYDAPFEIPSSRLPAALSALLPEDIVVLKRAGGDFHALQRHAENLQLYPGPGCLPQVMRRDILAIFRTFNQDAVGEACRLLEGTHDFRLSGHRQPGAIHRYSLPRELVELAGRSCSVNLKETASCRWSGLWWAACCGGGGKLGPAAVSSALEGRRPGAVGPTAHHRPGKVIINKTLNWSGISQYLFVILIFICHPISIFCGVSFRYLCLSAFSS